MGRRYPAVIALLALSIAGCSTTSGQASMPATVTTTATATVTVTLGTGDSGQSAAAETTIDGVKHVDACALLTQAEATALADLELQGAMGAGEDHGLFTQCTYTRDPYLGGTAQVTLLVGDGAKKAFDVDKIALKHPFQQLQGIGDEAWQEDGAIFLRVGTNWAAVELVLLNDPTENVKRLQQAATIAAGRM